MEATAIQTQQNNETKIRVYKQNSDLETPKSLQDKYTYIREIGHGTQGRIFQAKRNEDGLPVAIKQLNIESVKNWKAYDLFRRESDVLSSLDIPGVAKFYDALECLEDDPPCSYIVQEFIEGKSLASMIQSGHRFALNRVYDIILQLLAILKELHAHVPPVIHRDIKPSNILLKPLEGDDFQVYLIDFGAVANPQVQGGGSTVAGTFGYMAPEQMMGKPEPASDIYSLGAVAVHLISGRSPADMPVKDFHLIFEPDMQSMPPALVAALRRMLDPNVENRLCDIDILSELFIAFSNSIYSSSNNFTGENLSDEDYEARLAQVQNYGEDGNIALWQRLPDETPRQTIELVTDPPMKVLSEKYDFPEGFERLERERQLSRLGVQKDAWESCMENKLGTLISIPILGIFAGLLFYAVGTPLFAIIGLILDVLGIHAMHFVEKLMGFGLTSFFAFMRFWGIGMAIVIFVYIGFLIRHVLRNLNNERTASQKAKELKKDLIEKKYIPIDMSGILHNCLSFIDCSINDLLIYGRKTIATVTKIDYVTVADADIETQYSPENGKACRCDFSCHGRPRFVISYKFNPPDDAREEDIIHKIVSYTDVESHIRPGDPLPILYMIIPKGERVCKIKGALHHGMHERVVSMPFPYPLADPLLPGDMMFCDEAPDKLEYERLFMQDEFYPRVQNTLSAIVQDRENKKARRLRGNQQQPENSNRTKDNLDDLFHELLAR